MIMLASFTHFFAGGHTCKSLIGILEVIKHSKPHPQSSYHETQYISFKKLPLYSRWNSQFEVNMEYTAGSDPIALTIFLGRVPAVRRVSNPLIQGDH